MKKLSLFFFATFVATMFACSNASDHNPEATAPEEHTTPPATPPSETPAEAQKEVEINKKDTARTSISIGEKGGSVKTKKGTEVTVDEKGVKIGTKDVDIKVEKDTN